MTVDLHIHSNCSDGSNSVEELVKILKLAGIKTFALTDHDTVEGCKQLSNIIQGKFINGIELTCDYKGIGCHILGYYVNIDNPELLSLIDEGKKLRRRKLEKRIEYLKKNYAIELNESEMEWLYSRKSVVKTHLANILVNRGLAKDNIEAMQIYLDGCKCENSRFDAVKAVEVIKLSGGIPVWAHPIGGEGERHLTKQEFLKRLEIMLTTGIEGLECYYSRYDCGEIEFLVKVAEKNNLLISGGSDFHGSNKDIPIGMLNSENKNISDNLLTVIDTTQTL